VLRRGIRNIRPRPEPVTAPVGPVPDGGPRGAELEVPAVLVDEPVVERAEEPEVVEVGAPAPYPVLDVMAVKDPAGPAAGEQTAPVPKEELAPEPAGKAPEPVPLPELGPLAGEDRLEKAPLGRGHRRLGPVEPGGGALGAAPRSCLRIEHTFDSSKVRRGMLWRAPQ
jgi:hypothetical protein